MTEGSSDTEIIRKALHLLRPDVAHLFDFIDMDKNYPWTGTGNLHNFYQGLLNISILNSMVVVYDNDAAGVAKIRRCGESTRVGQHPRFKLPEIPAFESFLTCRIDWRAARKHQRPSRVYRVLPGLATGSLTGRPGFGGRTMTTKLSGTKASLRGRTYMKRFLRPTRPSWRPTTPPSLNRF